MFKNLTRRTSLILKYKNTPYIDQKESANSRDYKFIQRSNKSMLSIRYFFGQKKQQAQIKHTFNSTSTYYEILNLPTSCSNEQIKMAYLNMVKKYHPDLSKQVDASQKFQLIQKAYQVLSDTDQRVKYRDGLNIPNAQTYATADKVRQRFIKYSRKQNVADQWQFSYKLFKKHYQQIDKKQKDYIRFDGHNNQHWVHKDQLKPKPKEHIQQVCMVTGSIAITVGTIYYIWN